MKTKVPRKNYTIVTDYIADHVDCREDRFEFHDYSEFIYVKAITKGKIICPLHGEFWQSMNNHTSGHDCPECSKIKRAKSNSFIDFDEFLLYNRHKRKDGFGYYNYDKVVLKGTHNKVEIICPVEGHSSFYQSMDKHVQDRGCPKCANSFISKKSIVFFDVFNKYILSTLLFLLSNIYYGHNNEIKIKTLNGKILYSIDFAIIKDNIKIAVEYNGKYFHASPRKYLL